MIVKKTYSEGVFEVGETYAICMTKDIEVLSE